MARKAKKSADQSPPPALDGARYEVILRPLDMVVPYDRNAKKHPPEQVEQIAASIREFGFTIPLLVAEDGTIIAGHGRLAAAKVLGMAEVPVIVARGWSDAQRRAYVIADNKLAENAAWDDELLKIELGELLDEGFDVGLTGFSSKEIEKLVGAGLSGLTDPDDVPEPEAAVVSKPGDIWLLGNHRIICGDSTDASTVAALLDGEKPHLMVTDPPYGVNHDPRWREKAGVSTYGDQAKGLVLNDNRADWREAWALFPGDVAYVWPGDKQLVDTAAQLSANGFECRNLIVWAKPQMIFGRGDYHTQHETCWYVVRKGKVGHYSGDRKQTTLWQIGSMHVMGGAGRGGKENPKTGHSTQKPVECMKRPIENNSQPGDAVYEPFSGSGTTIIAAEMTGRRCYAIELNPAYVDVAVKRWQSFAGGHAVLECDGRAFEDVARERVPDAEPVT